MGAQYETLHNAVGWTDHEHFKNILTRRAERNQLIKLVMGYTDLLAEAFPPKEQGITQPETTIIPLEGTDVSPAGIPLLTQFMADLQAEIHVAEPHAKFSLAVIAEKDEDENEYELGIGALNHGTYRAGLAVKSRHGELHLTLVSVGDSLEAFNRASAITKEGFETQNKLFTFIVTKTWQRVQRRLF